jgi:hypothetical protein
MLGQCLGQQLAYVQTAYVWARLLLSCSFVRAPDAQPPSSIPPNREWVRQYGEDARHGVETVWPHASIILRVKVGSTSNGSFLFSHSLSGRFVGSCCGASDGLNSYRPATLHYWSALRVLSSGSELYVLFVTPSSRLLYMDP